MAERWRLKPEALGSIPGGTTFLSFSLPFQMSTDSNGPIVFDWMESILLDWMIAFQTYTWTVIIDFCNVSEVS